MCYHWDWYFVSHLVTSDEGTLQKPSNKSDMYSFGMVILNMVGEKNETSFKW
jgi:hypothetical protein